VPATLTYPGVYVEEIQSGVRTIVGVPTSVTAFVGATARGLANKATMIESYADFERMFGGLWAGSKLGYAVQSFYQNGGAQGVVVRVLGKAAAAAKLVVQEKLSLAAASPGAWGNALRVRVDTDVDASLKDKAFNLTIRDTVTGNMELHRSLTMADGARRVDKVLANEQPVGGVGYHRRL